VFVRIIGRWRSDALVRIGEVFMMSPTIANRARPAGRAAVCFSSYYIVRVKVGASDAGGPDAAGADDEGFGRVSLGRGEEDDIFVASAAPSRPSAEWKGLNSGVFRARVNACPSGYC
jgi:hypothetical protein